MKVVKYIFMVYLILFTFIASLWLGIANETEQGLNAQKKGYVQIQDLSDTALQKRAEIGAMKKDTLR